MPALLERTRWDRVSAGVVAGTSDVTSATVDMAVDNGYRGVQFCVPFGVITSGAVTTVKVQESADDSNWADLAGTSITVADTDDDKMVLIDIYRPGKRYIRCIVDRGTQNAVVDGIFALLYENNMEPVSQSADVVGGEVHVSPAAGTA